MIQSLCIFINILNCLDYINNLSLHITLTTLSTSVIFDSSKLSISLGFLWQKYRVFVDISIKLGVKVVVKPQF